MDDLRSLPISRALPARRIDIALPGDPLVLRPTLMTDAQVIHDAVVASLPELRPFMPWAHLPQTAEGQLLRLRGCEADYVAGRDMGMALFRGSELLSVVGLMPRVPLNPRGLEVGYWAPTAQARKGFTTLAVRVAALYAFDRLGCDRLQVMCDEANIGSRRVIEKCGFTYEASLRGFIAAPASELLEAGYVHSDREMLFSMFREQLERMAWAQELRPLLSYTNIAGFALP